MGPRLRGGDSGTSLLPVLESRRGANRSSSRLAQSLSDHSLRNKILQQNIIMARDHEELLLLHRVLDPSQLVYERLRVLADAPHGGGGPRLELRHIGERPG